MIDNVDLLIYLREQKSEPLEVPEHWISRSYIVYGPQPLLAANRHIENASRSNQHLLVLLDPLFPSQETIHVLLHVFDLDPYFGFAIPRRADSSSGEILKLHERLGDSAIPALPRQVLEEVPPRYILPEFATSCFVVRNSVLSNFDRLDESFETLSGAFLHYMWRARRCGFRCVVVNRAVAPGRSAQACAASKADANRLHRAHPDFGLAQRQFAQHSLHVHESLLAKALCPNDSQRQSLLIDARDLPCRVNGTVEAFLGICSGLARLQGDWIITLLVSAAVAATYNLSDRFPKWKLISQLGSDYFTAAMRPSQPWSISSMMDLHRVALFNFYTILDSISWDVLYVAPPGLQATWEFLSRYADGILYISQFTRDRFAERFPMSRETPGYVSHLSVQPGDYKGEAGESTGIEGEPFLLVVGNRFDHKNVAPTVDLLVSAFPAMRIKALGLDNHPAPLVETLATGQIPQTELDRLFRHAVAIIFPSFYEGFGFPVLKALSLGRTVLAYRSELLFEIASHYRGPGRLIPYGKRTELMDGIRRLIEGSEIENIPLGTALRGGEEPPGWNEIAAGILNFMEQRIRQTRTSRWLVRQSAIEQLNAYAYERLPGGRPY